VSDQSSTIRTALAAAVKGLVPNVQSLAYLPSNPTAPGAYVCDGEVDYDLAMGGGMDELQFIIVVLVGYTTDQGAQAKLNAFRDPNAGIKAAVEADTTLGGACDTCRVEKASKSQLYGRESGPAALGCEFTVAVYAPR
jgi:hypothetical protein